MNSIEYQVTIKSANQKVDDYVTKCRSGWSVSQLKQHISETHINRPNVEDQRLIYAGNLLKDTQTLKQIFFRDSLCTELTNSNKTDFTIHLVCSQKSTHNIYSNSQTTPHNNYGSNRSTPIRSTQNQNSGPSEQNNNPTASSSLSQSNNNYNVTNSNNNNITNVGNSNGNRLNQSTQVSQPSTITTDPYIAGSMPSASLFTNVQSPTTLSADQVNDIVANLMDSEQMRQQMDMFQELANNVAAQLINNLASTLTQTGLTSHQMPSGQTQNQDINSMLNSIAANVQVPTPAAITVDPRLISTTSQMIYAGNRIQTNLINTSEHGNNQDRNLTPQDDGNAPRVGEQPAARFGLGAVAQPQPDVGEQPAAPQVPDPDIHPMQHDVIDWVYYSIRAVVLMAALYIHASIFRLLFIFGLLAIAYFFNRRSARRNNPSRQRDMPQQQAQQPPPAAGAWQQQHQQVNNAGPVDGDGLRRRDIDPNRPDNAAGGVEREQDENGNVMERQNDDLAPVGQQPARLPFLKFCYLVITDFLASLVPE